MTDREELERRIYLLNQAIAVQDREYSELAVKLSRVLASLTRMRNSLIDMVDQYEAMP